MHHDGGSLGLQPPLLNELVCDTQAKLPPFGCLPSDHYPRRTKVVMHTLPKQLKTMPNPCKGVPANPWCRRSRARASRVRATEIA